MIDFSLSSCSVLKKLTNRRNSTIIVQKGPRLFSLDTIFDYQDFKISVKKLNLERRPDTVFSSNYRVKGKVFFDFGKFMRPREKNSSFLRSKRLSKGVNEEVLPVQNEKVILGHTLRSSSHHKRYLK